MVYEQPPPPFIRYLGLVRVLGMVHPGTSLLEGSVIHTRKGCDRHYRASPEPAVRTNHDISLRLSFSICRWGIKTRAPFHSCESPKQKLAVKPQIGKVGSMQAECGGLEATAVESCCQVPWVELKSQYLNSVSF